MGTHGLASGRALPSLAALLLLVWGGCAPRASRPRQAVDPGSLSRLLEVYRSGWSGLRSWDGVVMLRGRFQGEKVRVRQLVALAPPSRIYIEALLPFGRPGPVVAVDGDRLRAIWPADPSYLDTAADAASLELLLGLPVEPSELGALLSGFALPWELYRPPGEPRPLADGWRVELESVVLGRRASLELGGEPLAIRVGVVSDAQGRELYRFSYGELAQVGPWVLPREIRAEATDLDLMARVEQVDRNVKEYQPGLFWPDPPAGSERLAAGPTGVLLSTPQGAP